MEFERQMGNELAAGYLMVLRDLRNLRWVYQVTLECPPVRKERSTATTEAPMRQKASRLGLAVHDDPMAVALVTRAAGGNPTAREEIVERHVRLVWSIFARFQLSNHDREDVGQKVRLLRLDSQRARCLERL
jgi:hypothetical protein